MVVHTVKSDSCAQCSDQPCRLSQLRCSSCCLLDVLCTFISLPTQMSSPGMSSPPFQLSRTCPFKAQHSSTPLGISWPSQSLVISPTSALAPSFVCSVLDLLTCVQLFVTPQTVALPAPQPMEFPRQEYWSGLSFPPLWDLPDPGIEPASPALTDKLFTPLCHLGSPKLRVTLTKQ